MDVFFQQHKPTSSIANYLTTGCKKATTQTLGFELEHFVVKQGSLAAIPYCASASSSDPSVEEVLERIKCFYPDAIYEEGSDGVSHLFGLGRDKVNITLEPGAQLEISIGPAQSVKEIEEFYLQFRAEIDPVLEEMGLLLLEQGYHPTKKACEIPLLPKNRYQFMDRYFADTGKLGICMMRATASTQISVDYENEDDALIKLRIANALGPLLAFITDNSPVFETEQIGARGGSAQIAQSGMVVPHRMARMTCWDDTDPKRCLTTKGGFDEDFSFLRYVEVLMESPGIFLPVPAQEGNEHARHTYLGFTTFEEALPNEFIDEDLILHVLSLFFFDTRFKTYLELRQADSLPLDYALAYAALISGIFYTQEALEFYSERFQYVDIASVAFAKTALRAKGFDAEVYGRPASEWLDEMIDFAKRGLSAEDASYLAPLSDLVAARKTLLDI